MKRIAVRAGMRVAGSALLFACAQAPGQLPDGPASSPLKEVQVAAESYSAGTPVPAWVEAIALPPASPATANEATVVRLLDTQFLVADTPAYFVHRAITVNDPNGLGEVGQITIPFSPTYQRMELHSVAIVRGAEILDRTKSSTIRFLQRETGLEQGIYSGIVTASIVVGDVRVADTVVVQYTIRGQNPVFEGKYFREASWDQVSRVQYRSVILNYPKARKIGWRFIGDDLPQPSSPRESSRGDMHRLHFEGRDLRSINPESYLPRGYQPYRWLQFSEDSSWAEVADWGGQLFRLPPSADPGVREVADKLRSLPSPEERVSAALEFVQSQIRYFAVLLGESTYRPAPPGTVLGRRYGDCKDKSLLLIALLKELGIEARPVLLAINSGRGIDKLLPSPSAFDHVIVQVPVSGATFFLDPTRTEQHGRLVRMGQAHEGESVLVLAPQTRALATISTPNISDLVQSERAETARLRKLDGEGELEVRQTWSGVAAESLRGLFRKATRDQLRQAFAAEMERRYPGAELVGEILHSDNPGDNVFAVQTAYKLPKFTDNRDGNWYVYYSPTNFANTFAPTPSTARAVPIAVPRFPSRSRYEFEVQFPEDVSAMRDPKQVSIRNRYFAYELAMSFRGNSAKVSITLSPLTESIDPKSLPDFRDEVRKISAASPGYFLVSKSDIKGSGAGGGAGKDFKAAIVDRIQDTVEKITATIGAGKLQGADLAEAYCDRANWEEHAGKREQARADVAKAMSLAPNSTAVLNCAGNGHFFAGDFEKSVAAYSRAISLGRTTPETYYRRGISRFYLGQLDEAAGDLLRSAESGDNEAQAYSDLWVTWTYRRLGKPVPENVRRRAAGQAHAEWPRPALAMLNGLLTPDEMLAEVNRKAGDDREFTLAEAYFYLGQHYVALKDTAKAKEYFEKSRQQGVLFYIEHVAAEHELRRLAGNP